LSLDVRPFTPALAASWDAVAADSDDAWFWQTRRWIDWIVERSGDDVIADASFVVTQDADMTAICPLVVERGPDGPQFAFNGNPIAAPAIRNGIGRAGRQEVFALYAETCAAIAATYDVRYGAVKVPALCRAFLGAPLPFAHPLRRFGYFDVSWLTQIIDLADDDEQLWAGLRKGHKADVKRARRQLDARAWRGAELPAGTFAAYREMHARDAGRVIRSTRTFDIMERWVREGHAALVEAFTPDGRPAAFALLLLNKDGAFYGSGCREPELASLPASHLVQWTAMTWLKAQGFRYYDLGLQQFGPQAYEVPSPKDVAIAGFKRGFGGETVPLPTAERFYSAELLEETFARRARAAAAALPQGVPS
jgi:hypothetical protein